MSTSVKITIDTCRDYEKRQDAIRRVNTYEDQTCLHPGRLGHPVQLSGIILNRNWSGAGSLAALD